MPSPRRGPGQLTWGELRPVLLAALLAADAMVVAALGLIRPPGWVAPFIAFGVVLVGVATLLRWAIAHRGDG